MTKGSCSLRGTGCSQVRALEEDSSTVLEPGLERVGLPTFHLRLRHQSHRHHRW
jgi:hypothetical protein